MKNNIFFVLFHNPWNWTADYANQTALQLRKQNEVICVLFGNAKSIIELLVNKDKQILWKTIGPRMHIFIPLYIIPFRRFLVIERMNNWLNIVFLMLLMRTLRFNNVVKNRYVWAFHPCQNRLLPIFGKVRATIYDCVDYFGGNEEVELIRKSTHFFVNSQVLFERYRKIRKAVVVPQGFRLGELKKTKQPARARIPHDKPIIGYVGGINYRLDYPLLNILARRNNRYYFIFIGPIQTLNKSQFDVVIHPQISELFSNENCLYYNQQSQKTMRSIIQQFDICMIPYDARLDFNKYSYPMKLFEYFYMGKPVISTPIKELARFPKFVRIGSTVEEWETHIKSLLSKPWLPSYKSEQKKLAIADSWERKIGKILHIIESDQAVKKRIR